MVTGRGSQLGAHDASVHGGGALLRMQDALAHPASVDTIPTSAGQEDHVSMSTIAARKARDIASNVGYRPGHRVCIRLPGGGFQRSSTACRAAGQSGL
ncbi:MAG: aromatic amino acid lyase [Bacillota bacterium]